MRQQLSGQPFHMFDFTPVGGGIALIGVLFLAVGWRLLPRGLRGTASDTSFTIEDYTSELRLSEKSPFIVAAPSARSSIWAVAKSPSPGSFATADGGRIPTRRWKLYAEDVLVVEADPQVIEQFVRDGNLRLVGAEEKPEKGAPKIAAPMPAGKAAANPGPTKHERDERTPERPIPAERELQHRRGDHRRRFRPDRTQRRRTAFAGNAMASTSWRSAGAVALSEQLAAAHAVPTRRCDRVAGSHRPYARHPDGAGLPAASRAPAQSQGQPRRLLLPLAILALAIVAEQFRTGAGGDRLCRGTRGALSVLFGLVTLKEAYGSIEWPILVLLGALIPIGVAVEHTGTAKLIASSLAGTAGHVPGFVVIGGVLAATMLMTPFLHHAAAVLVMGPIAASLAQQLGYQIDPFLMAVAFGAGSGLPVADRASDRTRW